MTNEERLAEILRMTERYKADEERRRVRMVDLPQNAGNAAAIPETPWSSPDLDETAYLGSPSPPVQGQPGMPAFSTTTPDTQSVPDPAALPYSPPVGSIASTGGATDVLQPGARKYLSESLAGLGRAYGAIRTGLDAAGPELLKHGAGFLKGSGFEFSRQKGNEARQRYEAGDIPGAAAYGAGSVGYAGLGAIDAYLLGNRNIAAGAAQAAQAGARRIPEIIKRVVPQPMTPRVLARDATGRPIARAPLSETEQAPDEILGLINERLKATRPSAAVETPPATGKKRGAITDINLREMPLDEALKVVATDPHLRKVNPKSDYVGAPEGVRGPKTLQKIRDNFDADVEAGAPGADWYVRAQQGIKELAGPDPTRQSLLAREKALTSAQANPDANLGFAIDMHNAYEFGDPLKIARTGQIARTYNQTRDISRQHPMMGHNQGPPLDDIPIIPLGKKTGIYGGHMDPTQVNPTTGTNDIWHARGWGYTQNGKPWSSALTPQQHAFLDAETVKAVGRMNEKAVGGRTDWTPGEVQAAPWVIGKARGLKQQRPSLSEDEAMAEAIKSYPDHFDKYTFNQTYELTPGVMTGHRPDIAQGTQQLKEAYANDPRIQWTDPNKRDIINEAIGAYQRPTQRATGLYTPPGGQPEVNPAFVARPMVGLESGGTGVKPRDLAAMKGAQAFRAYMDAQGAGAGSMPLLHAPPGQAGSVFIPGKAMTGGAGERTLAELSALQAKGKPYGLGEVVDYGPGGSVMTDFPPPGGLATGKALRGQLGRDIHGVVPGAAPRRAKLATVYAGYEDLWGKESGAVTRAMFQHLDEAPPAILQRLDQDPNVRARVLEKMAVDAQSGAPVNTAVQTAREIYGRGGLVGLRKALADGKVTLPAVLVAIPGLQEAMGEQDQR